MKEKRQAVTSTSSRQAGVSTSKRRAAASTFDQPAPDTGFFNPYTDLEVSRQNLPHWRQGEVWYFLTYRLADSLPTAKIEQLETERQNWHDANPEPHTDEQLREYWDRFGGRIQDLLDAGSGQCWLRRPEVRAIVTESLLFGEGKRYALDVWVVMPNHVHVLLLPNPDEDLSDLLHTWKSYTAKRINKLLGRTGRFWQKESYDHIVRNPQAFHKIREYIRENPIKAHLRPDEFDLS